MTANQLPGIVTFSGTRTCQPEAVVDVGSGVGVNVAVGNGVISGITTGGLGVGVGVGVDVDGRGVTVGVGKAMGGNDKVNSISVIEPGDNSNDNCAGRSGTLMV
jgi:hypothetical protein